MRAQRYRSVALALFAALAACSADPGARSYRFGGEGNEWRSEERGAVLAELRARYPDYFDVIGDPAGRAEPDLRPLRDDLEHKPVDRRNYDALNAIAFGYFELNARAESQRGDGNYLGRSIRTAQLVAVPWRAYGQIDDPALRDAILDFFEDATAGNKSHSRGTAARLASTIASLEPKEPEAARRARIRALVERLGGPGEERRR